MTVGAQPRCHELQHAAVAWAGAQRQEAVDLGAIRLRVRVRVGVRAG